MTNILIIGATRGLGASLATIYSAQANTTVYGTARNEIPKGLDERIIWVKGIDLVEEDVGEKLIKGLREVRFMEGSFGVVIITAGYFATEDWEEGPKWEEEVRMYKTSSISPPFLIHALTHTSPPSLTTGSKILLISSESGSTTLRHAKEGGGNYAHHASKAALNMVGKLLSLDLKDRGVVVSIVHPGFMRTEMTRGVGFDKYWDEGGAVSAGEAAGSLIEWVRGVGIERTGEFWAPRGAADIGTADVTIGTNLPTPLQLPW